MSASESIPRSSRVRVFAVLRGLTSWERFSGSEPERPSTSVESTRAASTSGSPAPVSVSIGMPDVVDTPVVTSPGGPSTSATTRWLADAVSAAGTVRLRLIGASSYR